MSKSTKGTVLFHVMFPMHNSVNMVKLAARASAGAVMIWFGCRIYTGPTLEEINVNCQHCSSSTSLPKLHTLYFWKQHLPQVLQVFIIINGKIRSGLIVIGLMPAKCSNLIIYVLFIISHAFDHNNAYIDQWLISMKGTRKHIVLRFQFSTPHILIYMWLFIFMRSYMQCYKNNMPFWSSCINHGFSLIMYSHQWP